MRSCVGNTENYPHFSEMLLKEDEFIEMFKISMLGPAKEWFEYLLFMTEEEERYFDSICQWMNQKILINLSQLIHEQNDGRENKKKITYHLQFSRNIWKVIENDLSKFPKELNCPLGFYPTQLLSRKMLCNLKNHFVLILTKLCTGRKGSNEMRDINRILGWAVFHLRDKSIKKVKKLLAIDPIENEKEITKWSDEIKMLDSMKINHMTAVMNADYVSKFYDDELFIKNHGFLTLISEKYIPFGILLIQKITACVQDSNFDINGNNSVKQGKSILSQDQELKNSFLKCAETEQVNLELKHKVFGKILSKVSNTKISDNLRMYKKGNTARGGKK